MRCRNCQLQISASLDDDRPLSGQAQEHIVACNDCREFYELSKKMGEELSRQANEQVDHSAMPASLHGDLMAQIREIKQTAPPIKRFPFAAVAAIVLATLVAGAIYMAARKDPGNLPVAGHPQPRKMAPATAVPQDVLPWDAIGAQVAQLDDAIATRAEESYHQEFENLKEDLKSATNFLLAGADL